MVLGSVFDIKRYALHDGPGTRVTAHLKGCPLSCLWCHNPEGKSPAPHLMFRPGFCIACGGCLNACPNGAIRLAPGAVETDKGRCVSCGACAEACPACAREICGTLMSADDVVNAALADEAFFRSGDPSRRGGVTLSGGEPLAQPEFCLELLRLLGLRGVHRAVDTSGCVPWETMRAAAERCELFLYDIKHMDSEKHREYTGAGNELILSNLRKLSELGNRKPASREAAAAPRIRLRVPFIPGFTSDDENVSAIAELAASLEGIEGANILPYHKAAADKHRRWGFAYRLDAVREPGEKELLRAVELFEKKGIAARVGG